MVTYGFCGWPRFKQQFYVTIGFLFLGVGIIVTYLQRVYLVPYIWPFKYADIGLIIVVFAGRWVWYSFNPVKAVEISDRVIRLEARSFGRFHRDFLRELEKFPPRWEKSLIGTEVWKKDDFFDRTIRWAIRLLKLPFGDDEKDERDVTWKDPLDERTDLAQCLGLDEDQNPLVKRTPRRLRAAEARRREVKRNDKEKEEEAKRNARGIEYKFPDPEGQGATLATDQLVEDDRPPLLQKKSSEDELLSDSQLAGAGQDALTSEIARKFLQQEEQLLRDDGSFLPEENMVELWRYETIDEEAADILGQSEAFLYLSSLTRLTPGAAGALAQHQDGLHLSGLEELSVDVAWALSAHKHDLWLDGVTSLSVEVAEALAPHQGGIHFGGLTSLSVEVAEVLATFREPLELDGLTSLSVEVAQALAGHKESLALNGLLGLKPEVAQALADHVGRLDLDGLTSLSVDVARAFANHEGSLELDGLTSLTDVEVARALANNRGDLTLDAVTRVTIPVAEALAQNQYNLDIGLVKLGIGHAKAFGKYQGECLTLFNLTDLETKAARGLAKYKGVLVYQPELLGTQTVEILNDGGHF